MIEEGVHSKIDKLSKWFFWGLRPKTWIALISPLLIGIGWVLTQYGVHYGNLGIISMALVSGLSLQIATNLFNDALDFEKGADTHLRLGPPRLVQKGVASAATVKQIAIVFLGISFFSGIYLVWQGGWPIFIIGIISLGLAYFYTGGPWPLAYLGLGELFVILFFGIIPSVTIGYLLTNMWAKELIIWGALSGCWSAALILVNNLRDYQNDQKAGRKTLPIRFGITYGKKILFALTLLPSLYGFLWILLKKGAWISVLPLIVLPWVFKLIKNIILEHPSPKYNEFLFFIANLQMRWTMFTLIAFYLCSKFNVTLTN